MSNLNKSSKCVQTDTIIFSNQNIRKALEPFLKVEKIKIFKKNKNINPIKQFNQKEKTFNNESETDRSLIILKEKEKKKNNENKNLFIIYKDESKEKSRKSSQENENAFLIDKIYNTNKRNKGKNNIYNKKQFNSKISNGKETYKIRNVNLISDFHLNRFNSQESIKEFHRKKILNNSVIYNPIKIINYFHKTNAIINLNLDKKNKKTKKNINKTSFDFNKSVQGFNVNDDIFLVKMSKLKKNFHYKIKNHSIEDKNKINANKNIRNYFKNDLLIIKNVKIDNKTKKTENEKLLFSDLKNKNYPENEKNGKILLKKIYKKKIDLNLEKILPNISKNISQKNSFEK